MRNVVSVLSWCVFAVCFLLNSGQAQNNVNVRVMAANLNGNTQNYQPFALRIFQGLKPDVVAIQEFNYTSTNGLGVNTPAAFREMLDTAFGTNFVYFRESGSYSIPNGIVSRYPILSSGQWTSSAPDRGFAWAQLQLPGTNSLYVVSVHLLTSSTRATEAVALKSLIQSNFPTNAWVILAGDFNCDTRTESVMVTCDSYLSDDAVPVDDNGNDDTSINRNHPHDFVLPSFSLTNRMTSTIFPTRTYPNGLVFDSRTYTNPPVLSANFAPVQLADSGLAQHMAVVKDFSIPAGTNAPSFTAQPQSLTVVQGSNATFSVSAIGANPLAYQWLFGGTNIPGATTNIYSITGAQATNGGNYSVRVTNIVGSITSSVAVLTVVTAPVITANPSPLSVVQGNPASFSVSAVGILPLNYQWRFNGTNISGATTNPFIIGSAQLTNAGNYSVLITNIAGSVTSSVVALTVSFAATGSVVTLAGWDMSALSNYGPSPMAATTNLPILTVGGLTRGSGVTTASSAALRTWGGNSFNSASVAAATNANQFATFTIAANAGYTVSFTSLSQYDYKRSGSGPPNGVFQYRINAGAYNDITAFSYTSTTGASLGPVDLSGIPALQNVGPTNVVTFRFVSYGASSSGGNWYIFDFANNTAPDLAVQGVIGIVAPANPAAAVLNSAVLSGGQVGFSITGSAGASYVVQTSTNLGSTNWLPVYTNVSPFNFSDTNVGGAQKFYRAISP